MWAEKTPDAVAVVCNEQQLTYGALNRRANQMAHYLRALGVGPEVCVGLCMERSLELVVGLLGILKAGGRMSHWIRRIQRSALPSCCQIPGASAGDAAEDRYRPS